MTRVKFVKPPRTFRLPVSAVKTYQVLAPEATHWRTASCKEVDCENYVNGWRVRVEGLSPQQLHAVKASGRKFTELSIAEGATYLVFEAGQSCFKAHEHRVPVGKPSLYVVRDGDPWRGNPRGTEPVRHTKPELWVEDFAENQQRLRDRWQKG